jgi:transcriptional regulator with XRE-family HTH domain
LNKLKKVRLELGLTQKELSEKINLSRSQIANIENGTRTLTERIEKDMITYLGVNPDWLKGSSNEVFLDRFAGENLSNEEKEYLELFFSLDDYDKEIIISKMKKIVSEKEKE